MREAWRPMFVLVLLPLVLAAKPKGDDVHRPGVDCLVCHTADAEALAGNPAAARTLLQPDIEARCMACHGDEGPSHPTGGPPKPGVPEALPLSPQGLLTCATCHYMHGERNDFGDFVRIDNRRGGLCLTCHTLAELQQ